MEFEKIMYCFFIFRIDADIRKRTIFTDIVLQALDMSNIWNTDIE